MSNPMQAAAPAAASPLDALGANIAEIDAAGAPTVAQQQENERKKKAEAAEKELEAEAREWAQIPMMLGGVVVQFAPELGQFYRPEACHGWGRSAAEVAKKYGWKGTAFPELVLLVSTAGMVIPTVVVMREKLRQAADAKDGGVMKKIALWWRHRKAAQAQAGGGGGQQPPGAPVAEAEGTA